MKVLFVSNSIVGDPPGVSGGESRFIEIGKIWEKLGNEIHLFSSISGKKLCESMGLAFIFHNLTNVNHESRFEIIRRLFILPIRMPSLIRKFKSGIVYSTSEQIYDVLPGVVLKILYPRSIKLGVVVHWLPPTLFWKRENSKLVNSFLFLLSERIGLIVAKIFADTMLTVSMSTFDDLKRSGLSISNTRVVECGVNVDEISRLMSAKKTYEAIFMKRLQKVKGVFDLIKIWKKVLKKIPGARLHVVGEGIDGKEVRQIVKDAGLDERIIFDGVIYDLREKFKLVSRAKLFLLPSYEENWAIVIGEALASGTPVVCYDLKELRAVWENSVTYVPLGDHTKFAQSVVNLLENENRYSKIREKGLVYIKKYSWEKIAQEEIRWLTE